MDPVSPEWPALLHQLKDLHARLEEEHNTRNSTEAQLLADLRATEIRLSNEIDSAIQELQHRGEAARREAHAMKEAQRERYEQERAVEARKVYGMVDILRTLGTNLQTTQNAEVQRWDAVRGLLATLADSVEQSIVSDIKMREESERALHEAIHSTVEAVQREIDEEKEAARSSEAQLRLYIKGRRK